MTVDLFIRGIKADIGEQREFVRTFKRTLQFSDLENPTKITTDYTYSCTLPGTETNKSIFNYIENGTSPFEFNPAERYEFVLNVNGSLWLKGSIKLDKIKINKGETTFSVSFFSTIHDKIVELGAKKLTDLSGIADNDYFKHYLDCSSMANFWAGTHSFAHEIRYIPTRAGMYQDFQNDKFMTYNSVGAAVPVKTIDVGTDFDEYATKEYRIEYQRPAVNLDFLTKCIENDSSVVLDASLTASPLIQSGWMISPVFNVEAQEANIYGKFNSGASGDIYGSSFTWAQGSMYQTTPNENTIFNGLYVRPEENCRYVTVEVLVQLQARLEEDRDDINAIYMDTATGTESPKPYLTATLYNTANDQVSNSAPITYYKMKAFQEHNWIDGSIYLGYPWDVQGSPVAGAWCIYRNQELSNMFPGWSGDKHWTPVKMTFALTPGVQSNKNYSLQFTMDRIIKDYCTRSAYQGWWYGGEWGTADRFRVLLKPITDLDEGNLSRVTSAGFRGQTLYYAMGENSWSPLYANMNNILDSSMSQRDILTDLSKMTGCVWDIQGDTINIKTRNNFFKDYEIKDWTHKLDRSSDIEIKPLTYDKATYTMSYKDGDSFLEHQFKDKTGMDYGKQYINTGYGFNNDTESLLECNAYNTVMSKGDRKCITFDGNRNPKMQSQTPYEIPMIETKDNGSPKEGPRFVFDCGVTYLEKGEFVYITQDSAYMRTDDIGGKCWMDVNHRSQCEEIAACSAMLNAIPKFSTRLGMASFDFAKPSVSFSGENDTTYPDSITLYPRFWSKYLEDLYSAKSRVMTAWFWLSPTDLLTFNFKDFVIIDNKLWHPNKIIDFDITGESLTKCELVEVQDIESWVNGQNWDFSIDRESGYDNYVDPSSMVIYYPETQNENEEE